MVSDRVLSLLRCQSLERLMEVNGCMPKYRRKNRLYYICPFHDDHHPSFSIEMKGEVLSNVVQRFVCPSCSREGAGALQLEALFLGKPEDSEEVISEVARIFGISLSPQSQWSPPGTRCTEVDPSEEYCFESNPGFSDEELEALGCRRRMVYVNLTDEAGNTLQEPVIGTDGRPRYAYSWGDGFYSSLSARYMEDEEYVNFDRSELQRVFSLQSIRSFVTQQKADADGVLHSWRIEAGPVYPIFNFVYGNGSWGKKYEPFHKEGTKGCKFMFWHKGSSPKPNIGEQVYGDIDVMRYLESGEIQETKIGDRAEGLFEHIELDREGNAVKTMLFHHLVICSGPRDALSIYFHSSAHVVWFNSESTDISRDIFRKLKECCEQIYICYDIDETGIEMANAMAMKHLGLRVIYLPKVIRQLTDRRTGKPGKDAENFFNLYNPDNKMEAVRFYGNVNDRFATLMHNSTDMKFYHEVKRSTKKVASGFFWDYEISGNAALQLAGARHIYRYNIDENRHLYVRITDRVVDIIPDKDIVKAIRSEMKQFVEVIPGHISYSKLVDAITKSKNLSKDTCEQLSEVDLNLRSWDEDTEHFAFKDCVVCVTKDKVLRKSYHDTPYHFFRSSIMPNNFSRVVENRYFRIYRDVEGLAAKRREIDARMSRGMSDDAREALESEYIDYERLWGWRLEWLVPYEKQPVAVRFFYETGRMYWKKEKAGIPLTKVEQQEQDLHFIVKCNAMGYSLSRYRDKAKAFIVWWSDYTSMMGGKASGRTGKSALAGLKSCVRTLFEVQGQSIQKRENFSKNFSGFRFGVHANIFIDDLSTSIGEDQFYNLNTSMEVKTLYEDPVTIPAEDCPKVDITSNRTPDMSASSTEGRFIMVPVGGPIGYHKINGQTVKVGVNDMFGANLPDGLSDDEYTLCQNFLFWTLQFYFSHKSVIRPYMGHEGLNSMAERQVGNRDFVAWANEYFADGTRFGVPLSRREMFLDYMEYLDKPASIFGNNMAMKSFKELLRNWCNAFQYVFMPRVCYRRSENDERDESIRLSMWVSHKNEDGRRVLKDGRPADYDWVKGERCVYIFQYAKDVPSDFEGLVKPDREKPSLVMEEEEDQ